MTREEAIKMAKAKLECIERRTSGKAELCREDCESCSLCYEQGNMGDQMKWLKMSVKALEQEPKADVLDKIRAEIDRQEKWLWQAGIKPYNVDIAFSSIKSVIAESEIER